jgi:hypothetical protein
MCDQNKKACQRSNLGSLLPVCFRNRRIGLAGTPKYLNCMVAQGRIELPTP